MDESSSNREVRDSNNSRRAKMSGASAAASWRPLMEKMQKLPSVSQSTESPVLEDSENDLHGLTLLSEEQNDGNDANMEIQFKRLFDNVANKDKQLHEKDKEIKELHETIHRMNEENTKMITQLHKHYQKKLKNLNDAQREESQKQREEMHKLNKSFNGLLDY